MKRRQFFKLFTLGGTTLVLEKFLQANHSMDKVV